MSEDYNRDNSDEDDNFKILQISKLEHKKFFVADYQRGYKWTAQQVLDLLNDIYEFEKGKEGAEFYSLQPLAVKERNEGEILKKFNEQGDNYYYYYEVIDGQQRLTTIYLILTIADKTFYEIEYQTREKSAEFLKKIKTLVNDYSITLHNQQSFLYDIPKIEEEITKQWGAFIDKNGNEYNNIDNYHFFGAFLTIKAWLETHKDTKEYFLKKLKNDTCFIWYKDVVENETKKVFRNLNSGKIPLTNAELIKAQIIKTINSSDNIEEVIKHEKSKFATKWDQIEQELYDEEFWFFINNETDKNRYQTRIDFLFELLINGANYKKDKLFTYNYFVKYPDTEKWKKVNNLFSILKEWFENKETYHIIGFVISQKFKSLKEIYNDSINKTKTGFIIYLKEIVKTKISSYNINELYYPDKKIISVLLLHNIETLNNVKEKFARFSFAKFKTTEWSLEHIHAQNSKDLDGEKEAKVWFDDMIISDFIDLSIKKEISEWWSNFEKDHFNKKALDIREEIQHKIDERFGENDSETKHCIENMALLSKSDNSALNNSLFPDKRAKIIELENNGSFIPIATKNVFSKYYTKNADSLLKWTETDRKNYMSNITEVLQIYLPNKNNSNEQQ